VNHRQCRKCPWKVTTNLRDIPGGYREDLHRRLASTISEPGDLSRLADKRMPMMACHESRPGEERPCAGWLANQLGPGNNIALRLYFLRSELAGPIDLDGEQHERFEDTLP